MTAYTDFLRDILPFVPDCPQPVAENATRNACIEFCDRTLYYLHEPDTIEIEAGQNTYTPDLPEGTTISRVLDAWLDNCLLKPMSEDALRAMFTFDWRLTEGSPRYFTHLDVDEIVLTPNPQVVPELGLNLILALKPTRTSTEISDDIHNRWAEEIGYGALARLFSIPNQSFSDATMAFKYQQMFTAAIGRARVERNRGLTRASMRVRPPRFI